MLKSFIAVLSLLAATLVGVATTSAPANAYVSGKKCVTNSTITTCVEPQWRKQTDGSGVTLEGFWVDTTNNCDLQVAGNQYSDIQALWVIPPTETIIRQWDWNSGDCHFYKDLEATGQDVGSMDFRFSARVNKDGWGGTNDHKVYMGFNLRADGTYTVEYKFTNDL